MKIVKALAIGIAILVIAGILGWQFFLKDQVAYAKIATAYGAKMVCSCRFVAERPMESCLTDFTTDISMVSFTKSETAIRASVLGGLVSSEARNTGPGTGCTLVEK